VTQPGWVEFRFPLYDKRIAILYVPGDITAEDVDFLQEFLKIVRRAVAGSEEKTSETKPATIDSSPQLQVESEETEPIDVIPDKQV
jgi:hypothetical protein